MSIEMFDFKGHDVRVVLDDQGESHWIASDVAKALGYRDANQLTRIVRDRHKGYTKLCSTLVSGESHVQRVLTLNEPGLYAAVMKSQAKNVEEFQDWVTDEVLPSIRKHGGYISEDATAEQIAVLQRELKKTQDELTESVRREDQTYGLLRKLENRLEGVEEAENIRELQDYAVNVFDYIVRRTDHHGFATKWAFQLAKDTGRGWPYVFSDQDGLRTDKASLDKAWDRGEYAKKFYMHTHDGELPNWL